MGPGQLGPALGEDMFEKVGVSSWHRLLGYRGYLYQELTIAGRPTIYHYRVPPKKVAGALRQGGQLTQNAWVFAKRNPTGPVGGTTGNPAGADTKSTGGGYDETGRMVNADRRADAANRAGDGGLFA